MRLASARHANLVRRLEHAPVVERGDELRRVHGAFGDAQLGGMRRVFADPCDALAGRELGGVDASHVERAHEVRGVGRRRPLPEALALGPHERRLLAGLEDDEAIRLGERRHPQVELRRGTKREELIVELGALLRRAGVDEHDVEAAVRERGRVARLGAGLDVIAIEPSESFRFHAKKRSARAGWKRASRHDDERRPGHPVFAVAHRRRRDRGADLALPHPEMEAIRAGRDAGRNAHQPDVRETSSPGRQSLVG